MQGFYHCLSPCHPFGGSVFGHLGTFGREAVQTIWSRVYGWVESELFCLL